MTDLSDEQTKRILVTGGAGYIGSVLVGLLLQSGYRVRVLDNLMHTDVGIRAYQSDDSFEFVKGDICDAATVRKALSDIGAVVHLAAIVGDPACRDNPELATRVNRLGAELLCNEAIEKGVARFIFASTCSNYGKMAAPEGYVDENSELAPVSHYAELKVSFEQSLLNLGVDGFAPTCLRFATAYGLSPRPRFDLTVNEFTRELLLGRKLEVFGEQFWRPYCHTFDIARACLLSLQADTPVVAYRAFNVGDTDENYRKVMIVEEILKQLPDRKELIELVKRDEDPRDYRVNFDRINTELRFEIMRRVSDGIRETIAAISEGTISDPDSQLFTNMKGA